MSRTLAFRVKQKQMLKDKPGTKNQRPVKLLRTSSFLKCLEQTTVEFVSKKKHLFHAAV